MRPGLVADRRRQRRHVVHAADEDRTDQNPQQRRQPAEPQMPARIGPTIGPAAAIAEKC